MIPFLMMLGFCLMIKYGQSPTTLRRGKELSKARLQRHEGYQQLRRPSATSPVLKMPNPSQNGDRIESCLPLTHADYIRNQNPTRTEAWTRKVEIGIKSIGVVAFVLSCVALWPAVASAADTKLATSLAKWTSLKDFMEFCESVSTLTHQAQDSSLIL